jgi:hypothetical protein
MDGPGQACTCRGVIIVCWSGGRKIASRWACVHVVQAGTSCGHAATRGRDHGNR